MFDTCSENAFLKSEQPKTVVILAKQFHGVTEESQRVRGANA